MQPEMRFCVPLRDHSGFNQAIALRCIMQLSSNRRSVGFQLNNVVSKITLTLFIIVPPIIIAVRNFTLICLTPPTLLYFMGPDSRLIVASAGDKVCPTNVKLLSKVLKIISYVNTRSSFPSYWYPKI